MNSIIIAFLMGAGGTSLVAVYLVIYFIQHPEKFEKLLSIFYSIISKIWNIYQYKAIKNDVQGKINTFTSNLEVYTSETFPRITLKWTANNENEEVVWDEGEAIIVMRDRRYRNKNFVHAAYLFTSEILMKRAKRHLSKHLSTALDLYTTKKILEEQDRHAVEQFMHDYFVPEVEGSKVVVEYLNQFVNIDQVGMFLSILIQELTYLGNKVFLTTDSKGGILEEVKSLICFLEDFSNRQVGDTTVADEFVGNFMRCSIKIVASREARERWKVGNHSNRILEVFNRGGENVYLIGSAEKLNIEFMGGVAKRVTDERKDLQVIKKLSFPGRIILHGKPQKVKSHFIHIHNSSKVQHLFTQQNLEKISV